jgi:ribosomal protein L37E
MRTHRCWLTPIVRPTRHLITSRNHSLHCMCTLVRCPPFSLALLVLLASQCGYSLSMWLAHTHTHNTNTHSHTRCRRFGDHAAWQSSAYVACGLAATAPLRWLWFTPGWWWSGVVHRHTDRLGRVCWVSVGHPIGAGWWSRDGWAAGGDRWTGLFVTCALDKVRKACVGVSLSFSLSSRLSNFFSPCVTHSYESSLSLSRPHFRAPPGLRCMPRPS